MKSDSKTISKWHPAGGVVSGDVIESGASPRFALSLDNFNMDPRKVEIVCEKPLKPPPRHAIWKLLFASLIVLNSGVAVANPAARELASRYFHEASLQIPLGETESAAWLLELARWLDPEADYIAEKRAMIFAPPPNPLPQGEGKDGGLLPLLEADKPQEALLALKALSREGGATPRMVRLMDKLRSEARQTGPAGSKETEARFRDAEARYEEGLGLVGEGKRNGAFGIFSALEKEFLNVPLRPPFYAAMREKNALLRAELGIIVEARVREWEKHLRRKDDPVRLAEEWQEFFRLPWPESPAVSRFFKYLAEALDAGARPILVKARTLHRLEGCRAAVPFYRAVCEKAVLDGVPARREAGDFLRACLPEGRGC